MGREKQRGSRRGAAMGRKDGPACPFTTRMRALLSGPHGLGTGWAGWPDIILTLSQRNVSSSLAVGLSRSLPGPSQAHLQ